MNIKKALLVENDILHFDEFERILNSLNFEVIRNENNMPVTNFDAAINLLEKHYPFEIAIIDIDLDGDKNGIDLVEYLLVNKIPVEIILTSAYTTPEMANLIAELGLNVPIIPKPFGSIDKQSTLFLILASIRPNSNFFKMRIENLVFKGRRIVLDQNIENQLKIERYKATSKLVNKNSIIHLSSGTTEHYRIPRDYSLLEAKGSNFGYLIPSSLNAIINSKILDDRFIQINQNSIINILLYHGRDETHTNKYKIFIGDKLFEVTQSYRISFESHLKKYKLML